MSRTRCHGSTSSFSDAYDLHHEGTERTKSTKKYLHERPFVFSVYFVSS
jgi:hypothetical protein